MNTFDKLIKHNDYELTILDQKILVHNDVFTPDPKITNSSSIILNNLPNVRGKDILGMGVGTGIIAIMCAKKFARNILAVDIDKKALRNTEENIKNLKINNVKLALSNLYENVKGKFDFIFANLPIDDAVWNIKEKTVSLIERFLTDSRYHLNEEASIYLPWFSISDVKQIENLLDKLDYSYKMLSEEKIGFTWYLFIIKTK